MARRLVPSGWLARRRRLLLTAEGLTAVTRLSYTSPCDVARVWTEEVRGATEIVLIVRADREHRDLVGDICRGSGNVEIRIYC